MQLICKQLTGRRRVLVVVPGTRDVSDSGHFTGFGNHTKSFSVLLRAWNLCAHDKFKQMCLISNIPLKDPLCLHGVK